jgi:peptide-methionine (R)-S-oxide reductase
MTERVEKSDAEWRAELTPEQYKVTRQHGTERAGTSPLNKEKREGMFTCVCCGAPLFSSDTKFESGTGWPSFYRPVDDQAVTEHDDRSFLMRRTEVRCAKCDAHLGHVFPDGPQPTGQRYCMNGVALGFQPGREPGERAASKVDAQPET